MAAKAKDSHYNDSFKGKEAKKRKDMFVQSHRKSIRKTLIKK